MCDLGLGSLILSAAGGAYSAVTQSRMAKQNAVFARYEADQAKEIGRANEARARSRMDRLIGRQRGQFAARGVQLNSASSLDLGEMAAKENFMEAQATRFNTQGQVNAKTNEAAISDYSARVGLVNGMFGTATRSLSQALDLWPQMQGA